MMESILEKSENDEKNRGETLFDDSSELQQEKKEQPSYKILGKIKNDSITTKKFNSYL